MSARATPSVNRDLLVPILGEGLGLGTALLHPGSLEGSLRGTARQGLRGCLGHTVPELEPRKTPILPRTTI